MHPVISFDTNINYYSGRFMNFSQYANQSVYQRFVQSPSLAFGEKKGQYDASITVDLENADFNFNLNDRERLKELDTTLGMYKHIRLGEILEHLVYDYDVLTIVRKHLEENGTLLITVPFYGIASYHLRLHNRWSIEQLLRATGFSVITYIPRKAQRLDRLIAYVRGASYLLGIKKETINRIFLSVNRNLPLPPNGGYFLCRKAPVLDISQINFDEFKVKD